MTNDLIVERMAKIAEQYAAKQTNDAAGLHVAAIFRCIAIVCKAASKEDKEL